MDTISFQDKFVFMNRLKRSTLLCLGPLAQVDMHKQQQMRNNIMRIIFVEVAIIGSRWSSAGIPLTTLKLLGCLGLFCVWLQLHGSAATTVFRRRSGASLVGLHSSRVLEGLPAALRSLAAGERRPPRGLRELLPL